MKKKAEAEKKEAAKKAPEKKEKPAEPQKAAPEIKTIELDEKGATTILETQAQLQPKKAEELALPDPESPEKREKRSERVFLIAAAALILIIVGILLIPKVYQPKPPTVEYNAFIFEQRDGLWHTEWQLENQTYLLSLRYNPYEVENVPVRGAFDPAFNEFRQTHIAFDPLVPTFQFKWLTLGASELGLSLARALQRDIVAACTRNETEECYTRPIVSCPDPDRAVILLEAEGAPEIIVEGTCVRLRGTELELLKSVDKFLYKWYQIIPD